MNQNSREYPGSVWAKTRVVKARLPEAIYGMVSTRNEYFDSEAIFALAFPF
jgi:hypothetical protein